MVKGELRCLGSTQHLKNKYGAGYQLEVNWAFFEFGWFLGETGEVEWRQDEFWLGGPWACPPQNILWGTGSQHTDSNNSVAFYSSLLFCPSAFRCLSHSRIVGPTLWSRYIDLCAFLFHHLPFCGAGGSPVSCLGLPAVGEVQVPVQHRGLQPLPDHPWTGSKK